MSFFHPVQRRLVPIQKILRYLDENSVKNSDPGYSSAKRIQTNFLNYYQEIESKVDKRGVPESLVRRYPVQLERKGDKYFLKENSISLFKAWRKISGAHQRDLKIEIQY